MSFETPRVVWMPAGLDACAAFRMFFPHINMPHSQFLFKWGAIDFKEFEGNEVAVVQRQVGERNLAALKALRANGYKIVYDLDDNVWALVAANPLARVFKQMEEAWMPCAEQANVITVSTRGLASAVRGHLGHLKKEIIVCPNGIDFNIYRQATVSRDDGMVVIGWQGSNTHGDDIKEAWDTLPGILQEHENVRMEFLGHAPPKELWNHSRVKLRGWSPVGEFPARLASWAWDIALAPLEDTRFNRSKCLSGQTSIYGLVNGLPRRTSLVSFLTQTNNEKFLPGPDGEWRKVVGWEKLPMVEGLSIGVRGGDFFHVTPDHRFRLKSKKLIRAKDLKVGDVLDTVQTAPVKNYTSQFGTYENGWLLGFFLADGCMIREDGPRGGSVCVGFSVDDRRRDLVLKLERYAKKWGATVGFNRSDPPAHGLGVRLFGSQLLKGFILQYVSGGDCYTKRLRQNAWCESREFLKGVVEGWLSGDGYKSDLVNHGKYVGTKGNRYVWGFKITQNWGLVRDLQLACLLVGYRFRFKRRKAWGFGKQYKIISGTVRKTLRYYQSAKDNGEVLGITRIPITPYAVEVDGDRLFVLPSGVVSHNSAIKAMESASMKVPCLCSDVQPYNEWASLGGAELKWLLCNTQTQWRTKLKVLINEPERRVALGELAYKVTERFFNVKTLVENWKRACQLAMSC